MAGQHQQHLGGIDVAIDADQPLGRTVGDDAVQGPGHGTVLNVHGQDVFVHHGWVDGNGRYLFVSPITWADGWPSIGDGTTPESVAHWP